jgi:hypothetical protein
VVSNRQAAVLYPACCAGDNIPAGPDGIRWPAPHFSGGLEVPDNIQAWRVTAWPVCHHTFLYLTQPLWRSLLTFKWLKYRASAYNKLAHIAFLVRPFMGQ